VYGTYGSDTAEWAKRKIRCLTAAAAAPTSTTAMMRLASTTMILDEDLKAMFDEQFHKDYAKSTFEQIRELRRKFLEEKQQLDSETMNGRVSHGQYAENVNKLVNSYLVQAAGILGPGGYQVLFGLAPGERIGLVDPDIAARSRLP
jgi:hypothetical protein